MCATCGSAKEYQDHKFIEIIKKKLTTTKIYYKRIYRLREIHFPLIYLFSQRQKVILIIKSTITLFCSMEIHVLLKRNVCIIKSLIRQQLNDEMISFLFNVDKKTVSIAIKYKFRQQLVILHYLLLSQPVKHCTVISWIFRVSKRATYFLFASVICSDLKILCCKQYRI